MNLTKQLFHDTLNQDEKLHTFTVLIVCCKTENDAFVIDSTSR